MNFQAKTSNRLKPIRRFYASRLQSALGFSPEIHFGAASSIFYCPVSFLSHYTPVVTEKNQKRF